jgi:hypothetical protein
MAWAPAARKLVPVNGLLGDNISFLKIELPLSLYAQVPTSQASRTISRPVIHGFFGTHCGLRPDGCRHAPPTRYGPTLSRWNRKSLCTIVLIRKIVPLGTAVFGCAARSRRRQVPSMVHRPVDAVSADGGTSRILASPVGRFGRIRSNHQSRLALRVGSVRSSSRRPWRLMAGRRNDRGVSLFVIGFRKHGRRHFTPPK